MNLKKIIGVFLIIISVLLFTLYVITIFQLFTNPIFKGEIESSLIGILFFIGFTILLFLYGRKTYTQGKHKIEPKTRHKNNIIDSEIQHIEIEVELEKTEWVKLNFIITYTNRIIIYITLIGIGMIYVVINYLTSNSYNIESFPIIQFAFGIFCLIILPISTYIQTNKNFKSNNWINQKMNYKFNNTSIHVIGATIDLEMDWINIKSIKEIKDWYLIYTGKNNALFIPKNRFQNKKHEQGFRNLLQEIKGIKVNLKN